MTQGPKAVAARRLLKRAAIQSGLEALALAVRTGFGRGRSAIFTLHHVRPEARKPFDPSAHLTVTPAFLETAIVALKNAGHRPIALGDLPAHLANGDGAEPVMAFTLDDGYRDNLEHALPVFERHRIPFTVFVTGGFVDRTHSIWWRTAEALIGQFDSFDFDFGSGGIRLPSRTRTEKYAAFDRLHRLMAVSDQAPLVERLDSLARSHGIDPLALVDAEVMTEAEARKLAESPFASLGAHTISHPNLTRLPATALEHEIEQSALRVERITGHRPRSFAYPYGGGGAAGAREFEAVRAADFELAVTTRPDILRAGSRDQLFALNRISLNGYYQKTRYIGALASGLPFAARGLVGA